MNLLPALRRELLGESRRATTYWLRVLGAGALVTVSAFYFLVVTANAFSRPDGAELFTLLHAIIYTLLWIMVPLMTCDCISRERREGTLGLLFLTSLKPAEIAIAKSVVHSLRSLTVLLAVAPIISLPLLLGGVTNTDLLLSALNNLNALICGVTAGILASSFCSATSRAMLLSLAIAACLMVVNGLPLVLQLYLTVWSSGSPVPPSFLMVILLMPWVVGAGIFDAWTGLPGLPGVPGSGPGTIIAFAAGQVALAAGLFVLALFVISRRLRRFDASDTMSAKQLWWWRLLCSPRFFTGFFKSFMSRRLDRNPVGWLHLRTWSARVSQYGWLLFVVIVETFHVLAGGAMNPGGHLVLAAVVLPGMALSAAGSFRRERETGAFELLLVTPLRERAILLGRLKAIWSQYWMTLLLVLALWLYSTMWRSWSQYLGDLDQLVDVTTTILMFAACWFLVPIIGLYQSMVRSNFMVAWILTLLTGFVLPWALPVATLTVLDARFGMIYRSDLPYWMVDISATACALSLQGWVALRAWRRLNRILTSRTGLVRAE